MNEENNPILCNEEIIFAIKRIKVLKEIAENYQRLIKELEMQVKDYMQDNDAICDEDGVVLVTYKTANVAPRFDVKWFQYENPAIYEKYLVESKEQRRFLVK